CFFVGFFPLLTPDVVTPMTYMAAFVLWAPLGVVSIASTRRRIQGLAWFVLLSVVGVSWGLRSLNPVLGTVALAYPGFPAGIAAFEIALLLVRVARMKGKFTVRPPAEFWAEPDHGLLIRQLSLLYLAMLLGTLYLSA